MSTSTHTIFQGAIVHSTALDTLEILPDATLVINGHGKIIAFHRSTPTFQQGGIPSNAQVRRIPPGDFLIPGSVDTHNHAPQWPMRGLGQGLHILDWLEKITFPTKLSLPILYMPAMPLRAAWMDLFATGLRLLHTTVLAMLRQHVSLPMYA